MGVGCTDQGRIGLEKGRIGKRIFFSPILYLEHSVIVFILYEVY